MKWCLYTDNWKLDSMSSRTSPGFDKVHEGPYVKNNSLGSLKEETSNPTPGSTSHTLIPGKSALTLITIMPEWLGHSTQIKEKGIMESILSLGNNADSCI